MLLTLAAEVVSFEAADLKISFGYIKTEKLYFFLVHVSAWALGDAKKCIFILKDFPFIIDILIV